MWRNRMDGHKMERQLSQGNGQKTIKEMDCAMWKSLEGITPKESQGNNKISCVAQIQLDPIHALELISMFNTGLHFISRVLWSLLILAIQLCRRLLHAVVSVLIPHVRF